jgi:hypothetical protein
MASTHLPFALSLSKGFPSSSLRKGKGFDKLSPNGFGVEFGGAN